MPAAATFARASASMSSDLSETVTSLPKRCTISIPVAPTPQPTSSTRSLDVRAASENSSSVERCPPGRTTRCEQGEEAVRIEVHHLLGGQRRVCRHQRSPSG